MKWPIAVGCVVISGCGGSSDRLLPRIPQPTDRAPELFEVDVSFVDRNGNAHVGATIASSYGDEIMDVAISDADGRASVEGREGAAITGYLLERHQRITVFVTSDEPVTLREHFNPTAAVPFRVSNLAPGDPVSVIDFGGVVVGAGNSAGEFTGVALGETELDGEVTLFAQDSFAPTVYGATTNTPTSGQAELTLATNMTPSSPSVRVSFSNARPGSTYLNARPHWQDAGLFLGATAALTSSSGFVDLKTAGRDVADSVEIVGQTVIDLDLKIWRAVRKSVAWPPIEALAVDLDAPPFELQNIDYSNVDRPLVELEVVGAPDCIVGFFSWGELGSWAFVQPSGVETGVIATPPLPDSLADVFVLPVGPNTNGYVQLLDLDAWEPGQDPDLVLQRRPAPFQESCVFRVFGNVGGAACLQR